MLPTTSTSQSVYLTRENPVNHFLVSGPVSVTIAKVDGKIFYLFGDVHFSWENVSTGLNMNNRNFHKKIIQQCRKDKSNFINDFIHDIFDKTREKKVNLFVEAHYFEESEREKGIQCHKEAKKNFKNGNVDQNYGPSHYMDIDFTPYNNEFNKTTWIDIRHKLASEQLYSLFKKINRNLGKISISDNLYVDIYKVLKRKPIFNEDETLVRAMNNYKILLKIDNITKEIKEGKNGQDSIKDNIKLSINKILDENLIIKNKIDQCPFKIKQRIVKFIDCVINKHVMEYPELLQDYKNISENLNNLESKRNSVISLKQCKVDIEICIIRVVKFLMYFNSIILDVFVIANMFTVSENNIIIFMGVDHIENYHSFLRGVDSFTKIYEKKPRLKKSIRTGKKEYNRCIKIKRNIDDVLSFNF